MSYMAVVLQGPVDCILGFDFNSMLYLQVLSSVILKLDQNLKEIRVFVRSLRVEGHKAKWHGLCTK